MFTEADFRISPTVYDWTGRTISLLERFLKINVKLHGTRQELEAGEIFLFNHFARFETFIPQYLIYREIGAVSRSVGSAEFFEEDDSFSRYLLSLGGVPNDHPGLLGFLAAEVLRGRKIILFPEGGMVKDRRVVDRAGKYGVYSRSALERRKHHRGAAVVGLAVEAFRRAVREAREAGDEDRLARWSEALELDGPEALVAAARRPTRIVPANITFYPIRTEQNWLRQGAQLFGRGLEPRFAEELLIEGNLLLKDTDMDIRLGKPVAPADFLGPLDRWLAKRVARTVGTPGGLLEAGGRGSPWEGRLWDRRVRGKALRLRDAYMREMYRGLTVNLSHLAADLVFLLVDAGEDSVPVDAFHRTLYLAVKNLQAAAGIHLHRSLKNPEAYGGLLRGSCPGLEQLFDMLVASGLVERAEDRYRFLPRLCEELGFDEVRVGNPLAVYHNELSPLSAATDAVAGALRLADRLSPEERALLEFDDEKIAHGWDREAFHRPRHEEVNRDETATASGEPFLFLPRTHRRPLGVVLVHGFTASPAEMRPLGERLRLEGYPTLGVRLKGHGTSPWDLLERRWEDWLESVRRGVEILGAFAPRLCLVGFSTGGALALRLASEWPDRFEGVAAVGAPVRLRDRAMKLVPLVHGANVLAGSTALVKGVMLFHHANTEHPQINYRHMPIRALYELGQLIDAMEEGLERVECPVLLMQSTEDPTVDPESAPRILGKLGSPRKNLLWVHSDRHGILYENLGGSQDRVMEFLAELEASSSGGQ